MIQKNLQFRLVQSEQGLELEISNETARSVHDFYSEIGDMLTKGGIEKDFFDLLDSETKNNIYDFLKSVLAEYAMQSFLKNLLLKNSDIPTVRIEEKHLLAFYRFLREISAFFKKDKTPEGISDLGADSMASINSLKDKIAYFFADRYLQIKNV